MQILKVGLTRIAALGLALCLTGAAGCGKKKKPAPSAGGDPSGGAMVPGDKVVDPMKTGTMKPGPVKPGAAKRDPKAVAVVMKAIEAHGGLAALKAKLGMYQVDSKGTWFGAPFTMKASFQLPDKSVNSVNDGAMAWAYVSGDCWSKNREVVIDCDAGMKQHLGAMVAINNLTMLYPLADASVSLAYDAKGGKVGDEATEVVTASAGKGVRAVFHFSKKTGMLKQVHAMGLQGPIVSTYHSVMTVDGIVVPQEVRSLVGGKLGVVENYSNWRLGQVPPDAFKRPPPPHAGAPKIYKLDKGAFGFTVVKGGMDKAGVAAKQLMGWLTKKKLAPQGHLVFTLVKAKPLEIKVAMPLAPNTKPLKEGAFGIEVRPERQVALKIVKGAYAKATAHFAAIRQWIQSEKKQAAGPPAMILYSDPTKVKGPDQVAELYIPIK